MIGLITSIWMSLLIFIPIYESTIVVLSTNKSYRNNISSFGAMLPRKGIQGYLIHSRNEDGTDTLCKPQQKIEKKHKSSKLHNYLHNINDFDINFTFKDMQIQKQYLTMKKSNLVHTIKNPTDKNDHILKLQEDAKIILTARGDCKLYEKALNAQKLGASAIIIGNLTSNRLVTLFSDNISTNDIDIPVIFVGKTVYRNLYLLAISGVDKEKRMISINPNNREGRSLNLFIGFGVFLIIIGILLIILWYNNHNHDDIDDDIDEEMIKNRRKQLSELSKVDGNNKTCCVCLDLMKKDDDTVKLVNCSHVFHRKCIEPWVIMKQCTCPNCKEPALDSSDTSESN